MTCTMTRHLLETSTERILMFMPRSFSPYNKQIVQRSFVGMCSNSATKGTLGFCLPSFIHRGDAKVLELCASRNRHSGYWYLRIVLPKLDIATAFN